MTVFYGEYSYSLDPKNRFFVPTRFREELRGERKKHFMLTMGLDRCLYLFLPSTWEELVKNNMEIFKAENKDEERAFKRFFFGNASDAPLDEQGRILVPQHLKRYAGLSKNLVIRGVGNKAEIWNVKSWTQYKKKVMRPSFSKFSKVFDI